MATLADTRRYLTDFESERIGHILTSVLVVGSGVGGARAALEAARHGPVVLMSKGAFAECATHYAQGGIAAALADYDSPQQHFDDTLRVGAGLNDAHALRVLVEDGPDRIREVIDWGMKLDRVDDRLALTREGGHSVNRVVHAHGDQTGRALEETLKQRVVADPRIRVFHHCYLIDLITVDGRCVGAVTFHARHGHQLIWARQTVLATGGCGQIWRESTNPSVCTGDGLAAAYRASARLCDLELMQFHPTTLYVAGAGRALISEAVRGEGGRLVDRDGNRFMAAYHPDAELAPRDVVSRAISQRLRETDASCVYLDVRHLSGFSQRFPFIAKLCADFQIDVTRDPIPVRPSAHYMIGGVQVDLDGASSLPGLHACAEVSCNGVHGANRMASNSLLEGLVFGRRAGEAAGIRAADQADQSMPVYQVMHKTPPSPRSGLDVADIRNSLRSVMWRNVGIVRSADRLRETQEILDFWTHYTLDKTFDAPDGWEVQNMLTVARLIALSALRRDESVGVHFRSDSADTPEVTGRVAVTRDPEGTEPTRG